MPLAALLLVLGAALCHSAWNLLVKTDARRLEIQSGALIVGVLLCSPVLLIYSLADVSRSRTAESVRPALTSASAARTAGMAVTAAAGRVGRGPARVRRRV